MSNLRQIDVNRNELGYDAWGRNKTITDKSLLHGAFSSTVPVSKWKESIDGVEQTSFVYATSVSGKLSLKSTATINEVVTLDSYRNPRYRPNRGHIYSASAFFPLPTSNGIRDIGYFNAEGGFFFRVKSTGLYACRQTTILGVTQAVVENLITNLPVGFDLSKGNIYDIQMQWRGVGNIKFFVGSPVSGQSVLVHTMSLLGALDELSTHNPALPLCFRAENLGDVVEILTGCVDISTEGGDLTGSTYGSIGIDNDSGQIAISGLNVPVLSVKSKATVGGRLNTRDTLAMIATAYSDQRCVFRVWATRDFTAIIDGTQIWEDFGDGHMEFVANGISPDITTPMTFDTTKAKMIFSARVDQDTSYTTNALFDNRADIYLTPHDVLIFTMHRETGGATNVGVNFEFSEEI